MPRDVIMPALGMSQDTGRIVAWLKQPGDSVSEGDALFEVETDKATMEVEASGDGFLTDVSAGEGDDVPVGAVIAKISDTAEGGGSGGNGADATAGGAATGADAGADAGADDTADDLPKGHEVIMPTLGMAQDSGRLVAWSVEPGAEVAEGDALFEVETDKSTMEVEADRGGFVAALLAEEGEDVPTGQVIAILTAEKPETTVRRSAAAAPAPAPKVEAPDPAPTPEGKASGDAAPAKTAPRKAAPRAVADPSGRVLASPKLRRVALERGLDLSLLVDAGVDQPYHMHDLGRLEELARAAPASDAAPAAAAAATRRLTAAVDAAGWAELTGWLAGIDVPESAALATFAATAFDIAPALVAVDRPAGAASYAVASDRLSKTEAGDTDDAPALVLRDLRRTPLTAVELGAEAVPTITLTRSGETISLTLECHPEALSAEAAIAGLTGLAARLDEPLRHLL